MTNVLVGSFIVYFFAARVTRIEFELYFKSTCTEVEGYVTRYERGLCFRSAQIVR